MSLFSKTVAERTKPGQRQDVEEKCTASHASLSIHVSSAPCKHLPAASQHNSLRLTFSSSLHIPCIWPHRRRRWHHNQRPRLPCTSCTSTAVKGRRRISLTLSTLRIRKFEPYACFPTAQRVPRQIPGSTTSRQHNENSKGARRDKDCTTQNH